MANTTRRIHSKGPFTYEEYEANAEEIYPGMLIQVNSSGKVILHDTLGGKGEAMFAHEDALQGRTVSTIYEADDVVGCILPSQGCEVFARIQDAQDISEGDPLMSGGDGTLIAVADLSGAAADEIIAYAAEDIDATASSTPAAGTLGRVRVV